MLQMLVPQTRLAIAVVYCLLAVGVLVYSRREIGKAFRWLHA